MAFEGLTDKLNAVFNKIKKIGKKIEIEKKYLDKHFDPDGDGDYTN